MSDLIVDDYRNVTAKIEENVFIKNEVYDSDDSDSNIPLSHFVPNERGNVVEFYKEEHHFIKPEPIEGGISGSRNIGDCGSSFENVFIKNEGYDSDDSDSNIPLSHFVPNKRGNVVEFYKEEHHFIKPEPIEGGISGSRKIGDCGSSFERVKSHVCLKCDRSFYLKGGLNRHIKSVHDKLKKHSCGECDRAFAEQGSLKGHIEAVHRKLKKYSCDECDRAFTKPQVLKKHLNAVHRKLKKFICGECVSAFSTKESLKVHVMAVHMKLKDYACGECTRSFSRKHDLRRHLAVVHEKLKNS